MSSWVESRSEHFTARHDDVDASDAAAVLAALEELLERLRPVFAVAPQDVAVVLHSSDAQLLLARPELAVRRALTAPAARRYLAGAVAGRELHVLAPRRLRERASAVPDSREMLALTPASLYVRQTVLANNPGLRRTARALRWGWLVAGTGSWFSGQSAHARPAIVRRLREGPRPSFPPSLRDAELLGATVVDLLVREEGERAAATLATTLHGQGPRDALVTAFAGRPLAHTEGTWRAHLDRMVTRNGSYRL